MYYPDSTSKISIAYEKLWKSCCKLIIRGGLKHIYGALGAGRDNNPEKLSAGCQLYIVHKKEGLPRLDGEYLIFGQLYKGQDVLDAIASVKTDSLDTPVSDIYLDVNVISLSKNELLEYGYTLIGQSPYSKHWFVIKWKKRNSY